MYKLKSIVWEITLACPFKCKYCGSKAGAKANDELTTEEALDVAKQIVDMKVKHVNLIGGEVFVRKDWHKIAKVLTDGGVTTTIITNGYAISDEDIQHIKESGINAIGISIDSIEKIHDKYRQPNSYKRALNVMRRLREEGIPVAIISTINSENINYLAEFWNELKTWDIYAWQVQACINSGNASNNPFAKPLDHKYLIDFIERCNIEIQERQKPCYVTAGDNIGYHYKENMIRRSCYKGCGAGLIVCGIDCHGTVTGCESMKDSYFYEGNLRQESLKDIWENPDNFAYNRKFAVDMLQGKCKGCSLGGMCGAGCRATNFFNHKDRLYESETCCNKISLDIYL